MPTNRKTERLRRWAHEDAFIRGDEPPHISCDEILKTLDGLCDEIDGKHNEPTSLKDAIANVDRIMGIDVTQPHDYPPTEHEKLATRMRTYIRAIQDMREQTSDYEFGITLCEAYEAVIDMWEMAHDMSLDQRIRTVLAHISLVSLHDRYRQPLKVKERKGLVCWLITHEILP